MFPSKEIRWFFRSEAPDVESWFARQGLTFASTDPRVDFYLPWPENKGLGIKLREGRIEIKHLRAPAGSVQLNVKATGQMESYIKWSFLLSRRDALSQTIIQGGLTAWNWVSIAKTRLGVKLAKNPGGHIQVHAMGEQLPSACQLEYTRLAVQGETWYTFGLEWFGEEFVEIPSSFWDDLLIETQLKNEQSLGYAEFLERWL